MNTSPLGLLGLCLAALALLPGTGCLGTHSCTSQLVYSVDVTVVDDTSAPVIDATLTYSVDGGPQKDCEQFNPSSNTYSCGDEEAGHFVITATRGTATQTAEADVAAGECHVVAVARTITLPAQ